MDNTQEEPATLVIESDLGSGELVADSTHPILGALRRGMETGELTGSWKMFVAADSTSEPPVVIGTFVCTPRRRLLYFPGARVELTEEGSRFDGCILDHITLNPPRGTRVASHIAFRGLPHADSRGLTYRAPIPRGYLIPWFTLLVPDLASYCRLPAKLTVRFPSPRSDQVYGQHLVGQGGFADTSIPEPVGDPSFVQFDVWAGHGEDWAKKQSRPLSWVYKKSIVDEVPPGSQSITAKSVDVELTRNVGLTIIVSRPQGRVAAPRILRPSFDPDRLTPGPNQET